MMRCLRYASAVAFALVGPGAWWASGAGASSTTAEGLTVHVTVPTWLNDKLPLVRLSFDRPVRAASLPPLSTEPKLATRWEQIAPDAVQAVAERPLSPAATYTLSLPSSLTCAHTCTFSGLHPLAASVTTNLTWEAQLLAQLNYLPLSFTPSTLSASPSDEVPGVFTWKYPDLPTALSDQWSLGTDNIILQGALMTFQSQENLPVTGEADPTTWSDLLAAADDGTLDPAPYNYVYVSQSLPETLELYVAGRPFFRTLVNTGIPEAPTAFGTHAVYLRYLSQTMSGVNPDGVPYSDPGIPDISYFNGGEALHGFIRASYGFPQSLGCVEMPFASAATVFPHTPIGTLVTVAP